ncbi:hypothetical protein [Streptomyces sp. NPDC053427]|uniref:hypothetical protein n=1 Tax=Streptomyces sp. NPDC053427 TaxID=3365701 RepID=UPI0037CD6440
MSHEVSPESVEEECYEEERSVPLEAPATPAEWDGLVGDWDSLVQGYYLGSARHAVLECARHLESSVAAGGAETALWTLGLYCIGNHVVCARPHAESERRVRAVMATVAGTLGDTPCGHPAHPCDDVPDDGHMEGFPPVLEMLAHPERDTAHEAALAEGHADEDEDDEWRESWYEGRLTREIWACPRNLAGFARAFLA